MVSLQQALASTQTALGPNYENLGRNYIYLSFDKKAGWAVYDFGGCLGIVKRLIRWLGFYYSDTVLAVIAPQIIQKETNVPPSLLAKITDCWQRHGGQVQPLAPPAPPVTAAVPLLNEPQRKFIPDPNRTNGFGTYIGNTHMVVAAGDIRWPGDQVTTIVNPSNNGGVDGGGVHGMINAVFPRLRDECVKLPEISPGVRIETGNAVITISGETSGVLRVIHVAGPVYDANNPAESDALLKNTYVNALRLAHANRIRSIAFPAISTGIFMFPFGRATKIAIQAVENYAVRHPDQFDEIKLLFHPVDAYNEAANVWSSYTHPGVRDLFMQF